MVKADDYWISQCPPLWEPPDMNVRGESLQPKKQGLVTSFVNPGSPFSPSLVKLLGSPLAGSSNSGIHHPSTPTGSIHCLTSHVYCFPPQSNPKKGNGSLVSLEPGGSYPNLDSSGKKYLVFDQSEKGTRLIYGSSTSPSPLFHKSEVLGGKPYDNLFVDKKEQPVSLPQLNLVDPNYLEECGQNYVAGEGSEMHEDTEEINALLYSDDEDDYGEGADEEDEVTSTGHTPSVSMPCRKRDRVEHPSNEVTSSGCLNKRQKSIGGDYNQFNLSLMETQCVKFDGSKKHESDADSSSVRSQAKGEDPVPILGGESFKKHKILQMMKVLEGIVPGAEGKNPIVVLEEAIQYLKTMKLKAEVLGMNFL